MRKEKGRVRLRWLDDRELDLWNMGAKRRRTRALDTTAWAAFVRKARPKLKGCTAEKAEEEAEEEEEEEEGGGGGG